MGLTKQNSHHLIEPRPPGGAVNILLEQERVWREKPSLRTIYSSYFKMVFHHCISGNTLEIGAGSGGLKSSGYKVVSTDIAKRPAVDIVSDAQSLPFPDSSFENIVAIDAFHHLERPVRFLREAQRVLSSKGRLVMLEPGITPVSNWFYRRFHPESVDMSQDILIDGPIDNSRDPFDSNQAMGTLLATRFCEKLPIAVPGMRVRKYQWIGSLAYPLSGGFQQWCLVPQWFTRPILAMESFVDLMFGRWLAFRILIVLDKY